MFLVGLLFVGLCCRSRLSRQLRNVCTDTRSSRLATRSRYYSSTNHKRQIPGGKNMCTRHAREHSTRGSLARLTWCVRWGKCFNQTNFHFNGWLRPWLWKLSRQSWRKQIQAFFVYLGESQGRRSMHEAPEHQTHPWIHVLSGSMKHWTTVTA